MAARTQPATKLVSGEDVLRWNVVRTREVDVDKGRNVEIPAKA